MRKTIHLEMGAFSSPFLGGKHNEDTNNITVGIKEEGVDIKDKIKPIILDSKEFVLVAYNFYAGKYAYFIYYAFRDNKIAIKGIIIPKLFSMP